LGQAFGKFSEEIGGGRTAVTRGPRDSECLARELGASHPPGREHTVPILEVLSPAETRTNTMPPRRVKSGPHLLGCVCAPPSATKGRAETRTMARGSGCFPLSRRLGGRRGSGPGRPLRSPMPEPPDPFLNRPDPRVIIEIRDRSTWKSPHKSRMQCEGSVRSSRARSGEIMSGKT